MFRFFPSSRWTLLKLGNHLRFQEIFKTDWSQFSFSIWSESWVLTLLKDVYESRPLFPHNCLRIPGNGNRLFSKPCCTLDTDQSLWKTPVRRMSHILLRSKFEEKGKLSKQKGNSKIVQWMSARVDHELHAWISILGGPTSWASIGVVHGRWFFSRNEILMNFQTKVFPVWSNVLSHWTVEPDSKVAYFVE